MSDLVALLKAVSTLGGLRSWFHFLRGWLLVSFRVLKMLEPYFSDTTGLGRAILSPTPAPNRQGLKVWQIAKGFQTPMSFTFPSKYFRNVLRNLCPKLQRSISLVL